MLKARVAEPGEGRVLVVDGGGSLRIALLGDMVAGLAAASGWAGLVIHGCVRDVAVLRHLPIGIKALGSNPRPSGKAGAGEIDVRGRVRRHHVPPGSDADERRRRHRRARIRRLNEAAHPSASATVTASGRAASIEAWPSHLTMISSPA